ncbi:hypothetical protein MXD59_12585 [Frankia sp. Ag45/Mut15]|uniref:Secreted protein n=1 Tax=Frankia umida TaxID=573489 RepID=A0ABT0JYI2_9ACTN|nr:hypothetical protein [Frankia umida]MCK9876604.1 hypothetical protein [Frankia umida]
MDTAELVVSIVTVVAASIYSHSQRRIAVRAAEAAERAADEARRAADEARRSADAEEEATRIEQERRADELADAERRRVVFRLRPLGKDNHALHHSGTDSAYGVHVDIGDLDSAGRQTDFDEIPPGLDHLLYLSQGFETATTHIVVSWHLRPDRSDSQQSVKLLIV